MRDAFGGAFLIKIFLVFILIYICFTSLAINYAKAFKVKNKLIEYLESSEIVDLNVLIAAEEDALETFIDQEIVGNMNYNISDIGKTICDTEKLTDDAGKVIAWCHNSGIFIEQETIKSDEKNTEGVYYTVTTYIGWMAPFLNLLTQLNGNNDTEEPIWGLWEISGQTRLIVNK